MNRYYSDLWCYNSIYSQWKKINTASPPPPLYEFEYQYFQWNGAEYLSLIGSPTGHYRLDLYM